MKTWANHLIQFHKTLKPPSSLPNNVEWLLPHQQEYIIKLQQQFFEKYFSDDGRRTLMLGINPGRFGAGTTGINFTAPKQLTEECRIQHNLKMQSELSAEFIYEVISTYGGPEKFYHHFYIGSVCPLGFTRRGKNLNYYDDKELLQTIEPFIIKSISSLVSFNTNTNVCICIGGEKNFTYLNKLNEQQQWFKNVIPVAHPRFILQYRRKQKENYIKEYVRVLTSAATDN
jgi:hypothetical protein